MTELAIPENRGVVTAAEFDAAMKDAKAKAQTLARIVEDRKLYTNIQGKKYLEVEAWETIGRAYGYTAKTEWTRPIDGGGWEARAVVIDGFGVEVGAAETECGTDRDRPWDTRPSAHQRSMAQTRAVSKALRSVLSWVVVLAGYEPTPSNEMPSETQSQGVLSTAQINRLHAKARAANTSKERYTELLVGYGVQHAQELTREQYDELCAYLDSVTETPAEGQGSE